VEPNKPHLQPFLLFIKYSTKQQYSINIIELFYLKPFTDIEILKILTNYINIESVRTSASQTHSLKL